MNRATNSPDISIVIVNWNTADLLLQCIQIASDMSDGLALEFIVIDNASTDDSVARLRARFPDARVIQNTDNVGFARANNQGVHASRALYSLLLNSDAFLKPGALRALLDVMTAQPKAALVGAHLRNADGSFQASHTAFPTLWREFLILSALGRSLLGRHFPSRGPDETRGAQVADYVEGACMLVRNDTYLAAGGLDENFFMYAEEVDLCYRLKQAGWEVWYQPSAWVTHLGGGSSKERKVQREVDLYRSRVQFFRKHHGKLAGDLLKVQILAFTATKRIANSFLKWVTHGRRGRAVAPLGDLFAI